MPVRLRSVTLTSGEVLNLGDNITLLVGPNNVGKSLLLNSTWSHLSLHTDHPTRKSPIVESVQLALPSPEEFTDALLKRSNYRPAGSYPQGQYGEGHYVLPYGNVVYESAANNIYVEVAASSSFQNLCVAFGISLTPETRLNHLGGAQIPDLRTEFADQPLQLLWQDRELEAKLGALARRAFGIDLTVNRFGGSQTNLHVGKPTTVEPLIGEKSPYLDEIAQLPLAANQGHGIQAFLGMLMLLMTRQYDFVLLDEPEAFLHPPQARLLGEILVELSSEGTQFVISTHSDDFLQGVLTASRTTVETTVARLTRPTSASNSVAQVAPEAVRKLYEDPLLRYSKILGGIFYKGVVLCEAESDCKYYAAVLDEMYSAAQPNQPRPDLLFTQCSGKDRFGKAVQALQATKVPTAVIADLDLLADEAKFRELFSIMGGDWSGLQSHYNTVVAAVRSQATTVKRSFAKYEVDQVFAGSQAESLTRDEAKKITEVIRSRSGWEQVKKNGIGSLPKGDATSSFNAVLEAAAALGLFLLPNGELERFHPIIGGTKQEWLRQVFETEAYKLSSDATRLLTRVTDYIASAQ